MHNDGKNLDGDNETNPFVVSNKREGNRTDTSIIPRVALKPQPANTDYTAETVTYQASDSATNNLQWSVSYNNSHKRTAIWYIIGVVIIIALAGAAYAIQTYTGEWQFWSTVGLAMVTFFALIATNRNVTETMNYSLDNDGLSINNKYHPFDNFRAFGLSNDSNSWVVTLIPVKKLSSATTLIIPDDQGETIVDILGSRLPMEKTETNIISELSRRLKLGPFN